MENTQQLPAIIQSQVEAIRPIGEVYTQNTSLTARAKAALAPVKTEFDKLDLTTLKDHELSDWDTKLNGLGVKLSDAKKINNARRSPITQAMTAAAKLFTGDEAELDTEFSWVAAGRGKIAQIRLAAQRKAEQDKADKLQAESEKADMRARIVARWEEAFAKHSSERMKAMNDTFYLQTIGSLDEYTQKATNPAVGILKKDVLRIDNPISTKFVNAEQVAMMVLDVFRELWPSFEQRYKQAHAELSARLNEVKESRKAELKRIAEGDQEAARMAKERQEAERKTAQEKADQEARDRAMAAQVGAETAKLDAAFTVEATADAAPQQAKGTTVKKKYEIARQGWVAILQWYVSNELPKMTDAELEKKFGFMVAPANKALNAGVELSSPGLRIVDDITTKTSRK